MFAHNLAVSLTKNSTRTPLHALFDFSILGNLIFLWIRYVVQFALASSRLFDVDNISDVMNLMTNIKSKMRRNVY